jgi:hypothetical protein
MKRSRIGQSVILAVPLALSARLSITGDCGGPEYRWANADASMVDAVDSLQADVQVGVSEQRGGGQADAHSLSVNVQARPQRTTVLPLPALFGHATGARLERADGSVILQTPLHTRLGDTSMSVVTASAITADRLG